MEQASGANKVLTMHLSAAVCKTIRKYYIMQVMHVRIRIYYIHEQRYAYALTYVRNIQGVWFCPAEYEFSNITHGVTRAGHLPV